MDNEKNEFSREESPIGIKPLEDDVNSEYTNEIKLVRTQSIPIPESIELPIEKTDLYPTREVRVVSTQRKDEEVKVEPEMSSRETISSALPKEEEIKETIIPETPSEPTPPSSGNNNNNEEKKKINKQDIIMYAIMVIIVIIILLLGIRYCSKMKDDDRTIPTTAPTTIPSTSVTTKATDSTQTTSTTSKKTDATSATTTTTKKTDAQGYTGTTSTTTRAGDITQRYVVKAANITFKNAKKDYKYSIPSSFSVTVTVIGKKDAVTKVGTPKLAINVGTMKGGVSTGKVEVNGTYNNVKISISPNTVNVTVKEPVTQPSSSSSTTKKEDQYTYTYKEKIAGATYTLLVYKNGEQYTGRVALYVQETGGNLIGSGKSSGEGVTVPKLLSDLSAEPTLYVALESECDVIESKPNECKRFKMTPKK